VINHQAELLIFAWKKAQLLLILPEFSNCSLVGISALIIEEQVDISNGDESEDNLVVFSTNIAGEEVSEEIPQSIKLDYMQNILLCQDWILFLHRKEKFSLTPSQQRGFWFCSLQD
jgi:hypothetical protein